MKTLEYMISQIHRINHLWHLSLDVGEKGVSSFLGTRKTQLQKKLLETTGSEVFLELDRETSETFGANVYVIRIAMEGEVRDACHIPENLLDSELLKKLSKEGRVR